MRFLGRLAYATALLLTTTAANTEKVIFTAPTRSKLPDSKPGSDFLDIISLSSTDSTLRTSIAVSFTSSIQPKGVNHWYLLRDLHAAQRYEVRVCWSATQPTRFELDVHTISDVFDTPHLIQSLAQVVHRPQPKLPHTGKSHSDSLLPSSYDSVLFLHIRAAADYFSSNQTLMQHPPSVDVDIILDPYIGSIFPQSLLSTAVYLIVLTFLGLVSSQVSWFFLKPASIKEHSD